MFAVSEEIAGVYHFHGQKLATAAQHPPADELHSNLGAPLNAVVLDSLALILC